MRMPSTILFAALLAAAAACQKKSPPTPEPGPGGIETIRGTERLGWDQGAADTVELATFRYAIYVDGSRQEMADVSCGSTSGSSGFACSGRLPAMTPGQHTLELAAFVVDGGNTLESSRSVALRVNVTAALAGVRAGSLRAGFAGTTSDGVALRLDVVLSALDGVSDLAFAPDGRLFIAERDGLLRIIEPGGQTQARSTVDAAAGEILGLAIDPQFERTRHIYVAQAAASDGADERDVTISRYREINGVLGERMVLLRGVPARTDRASAALAIGPDGKLYVALDDGGDPASADAAPMLNGKVLRLNKDGTTPDGPPGTPVFLKGYRSPRALEWTGGVLWIADGEPRSPERLIAAVTDPAVPGRARIAATYALPPDTDPSDVMCYRGELFPSFRGNLFVSAEGGSQLLRVRTDPRAPGRVVATEPLLEGIGPIRSVAMGPDGGIYVATETSVGRVSPARRIPHP